MRAVREVRLRGGAVAVGERRGGGIVHDRLAVDLHFAADRRSVHTFSIDGEERPRDETNRDLVGDRYLRVVCAATVAVDDACSPRAARHLVDNDVIGGHRGGYRQSGGVEGAAVGELRAAGVERGRVLRRIDTRGGL